MTATPMAGSRLPNHIPALHFGKRNASASPCITRRGRCAAKGRETLAQFAGSRMSRFRHVMQGPITMDFALSSQQESIRDAILKICARFDDAYWLEKDRAGGFPHEF